MGDALALTAVTAENELAAAFHLLDAQMRTKCQMDGEVAYFRPRTPGGSSSPGVYWFPDDQFWAQLGEESGGTRFWCACGITSPFEQSEGVPVCEINPPLKGRGAGCSGAFARDEAGKLYLLHTGKFGGRFRDIRADVFLEAYEGVQARVTWPAYVGGGVRRMCVVGRLDDELLVQCMGAFVRVVAQFKRQMKDRRIPPLTPKVPFGRTYLDQPQPLPRTERTFYTVDPDTVGRGVNAHWDTQDKLIRYLRAELAPFKEVEIYEWAGSHRLYDVLWQSGSGVYWVAEVKSLTKLNEEHQLRLGLGQVLQYRWWLSKMFHTIMKDVRAILVVEVPPTRASDWQEICAEANVVLVWPDVLPVLGEHIRRVGSNPAT